MADETRGIIIDTTPPEVAGDQPRDPGRRRALRIIGATIGGAALTGTGFLAGRVTAPNGETPKAVSTASQAATVPQVGKDRETSDLSLADYFTLSHKDQDQRLKSLVGKDVNLQVDIDDARLIESSSLYYKDGVEKYYDPDDKTPLSVRGQLVSTSYLLMTRKRAPGNLSGSDYISFDIVGAVLQDTKKGYTQRPGYYSDYSEYSKAFKEAQYVRDYMNGLWIATDPKHLSYRYEGDTSGGRVIPNGTTLKLSVDGDPKATYPPTPKFKGATLAPKVTVAK